MSTVVATGKRNKPLVIGLTGGIGSGKSVVLADLVSLGAEGIDADRVAHEVMAPDGPAYAPIVAEFGRDILAPDGQIDRGELGRRVFADPAQLARLEAIVHPAVGEAIAAHVAASQAPAVVIEAIKLFEAGLSRRLCDEVWVTRCSLRAADRALAGQPRHAIGRGAPPHGRADADAADDRAGPPRDRHRRQPGGDGRSGARRLGRAGVAVTAAHNPLRGAGRCRLAWPPC